MNKNDLQINWINVVISGEVRSVPSKYQADIKVTKDDLKKIVESFFVFYSL